MLLKMGIISTWSKIAEEKLKAKGWWGSKEVINPKTGEVKKLILIVQD